MQPSFRIKLYVWVWLFLSTGSHKDGYETFASWKKVWTTNGKSEPSLKAFMADQQLPFWVSGVLPIKLMYVFIVICVTFTIMVTMLCFAPVRFSVLNLIVGSGGS